MRHPQKTRLTTPIIICTNCNENILLEEREWTILRKLVRQQTLSEVDEFLRKYRTRLVAVDTIRNKLKDMGWKYLKPIKEVINE